MNKLIVFLSLVFFAIALVSFASSEAVCWNCTKGECWQDVGCGYGCWCYKKQNSVVGVCLEK